MFDAGGCIASQVDEVRLVQMVADYTYSGTRPVAKIGVELAGGIAKVLVVQDEVGTLDDASSFLLVGMYWVVETGCSDL